MERAHGELRARLADGLRGDDADRFALLDHAAGSEVASVAAGAGAAAAFASEYGADLDPLDTGGLYGGREVLGDLRVRLDQDVAFVVHDLVERNALHDAVAQRLDFDARFDDRLNEDAVSGPAVELADDHVLSNVHQATRQVAGVRGLERGIGAGLCARRESK